MGLASMNSADFVCSDDRSPEAKVEGFPRDVRHILVPIDLAQDSLRTIAYAIRLGQHFGSRLTLLHVYQPPIAFGIPSWTSRNAALLKDRQEVEEILKAQGALVRAAYPNCEWILRSGHPGKGIVEVAFEFGVDLIVISSHHQRWCNRYRPANIADDILRHTACPILEVSDSGASFLNCLDHRAGGMNIQ
jgi:nucleotide-binding universal stress UspA family protein